MVAAVLFLITTAAAQTATKTADAPRISKEDAKALLGAPKVVFLDARVDTEWKSSDKKIKGAVRVVGGDYENWARKYDKDTTFVVYCS
jgi:rhodanese-related sulfurtransferase